MELNEIINELKTKFKIYREHQGYTSNSNEDINTNICDSLVFYKNMFSDVKYDGEIFFNEEPSDLISIIEFVQEFITNKIIVL